MDGYLETDNAYIFVEAKCREPYGAKHSLVDEAYEKLYKHISDDVACNLKIKTEKIEKKLRTVFSVEERIILRFDIKQMICHLLGVATKLIEERSTKRIEFLYLVYNPRLLAITDEKRKKQILDTYDGMVAECEAIDFRVLFGSVLRFIRDKKEMQGLTDADIVSLADTFSFTLCDQSDFIEKLK